MRIVAGKHKGLKLSDFDFDNIRPTIDRVRENIFNKIQFNVPNANVLDLFGGTGAVSLEFVSRGAKKVTTCDSDNRSIRLIKENFARAHETPNLIIGDYLNCLSKLKSEKFDIVFLDPPFATDYAFKAMEYIIKNNMCNDNCIIIYEHPVDKLIDILPSQLHIVDTKKYGTISVTFLEYAND